MLLSFCIIYSNSLFPINCIAVGGCYRAGHDILCNHKQYALQMYISVHMHFYLIWIVQNSH